jgi:hypothetical protein
MAELPESAADVRARLDGAQISVVAEVSLGAVGAQELKLKPMAPNSPAKSTTVRMFFTIARKFHCERTRIILFVHRFVY